MHVRDQTDELMKIFTSQIVQYLNGLTDELIKIFIGQIV
jgi:hypothetical protein